MSADARRSLQTRRTTVRRKASRGRYDRDALYAILDEALMCHVAAVIDGVPVQVPTIHARQGDRLLLHGSTANRLMSAISDGREICTSVAIVDGLVVTRAAFALSMNYRSAVVYGRAEVVADPEAKAAAMACICNAVVPGVMDRIRAPAETELEATLILAIPIVEASVKVREGGPVESAKDRALPGWSGVIPAHIEFGAPTPAAYQGANSAEPAYVSNYERPWHVRQDPRA